MMSAKDQLANDGFQIKNKWKDPEGTNGIQVEAEEEDAPQQWEERVGRSIVLIKAEWWGLAYHWKDVMHMMYDMVEGYVKGF